MSREASCVPAAYPKECKDNAEKRHVFKPYLSEEEHMEFEIRSHHGSGCHHCQHRCRRSDEESSRISCAQKGNYDIEDSTRQASSKIGEKQFLFR